MSDPLRFFVPAESLAGTQVNITGEPYHHLRNVLRIKAGARVLLLDGSGGCCEVELIDLQPEQAKTRVVRCWHEEERVFPVTLVQSLPKGDKFEVVLQKGTELGVTSFQPVVTAHSVPNLNPARQSKRQLRWQRIVTEAARQSRRSTLPEVKPLQTLAELLAQTTDELKLVLWEAGSVPIAAALPKQPPIGIRLLIGPEGGFSRQEIAAITAAGYQSVHLGPRILRTETAGLAATPVLQYLYGDWQQAPETMT